eukprot:TRINITY_DN2264_c0_g4_i1.p1 TRINITY_DN2264_c0_g4~~TRINITY_DN2264_c0_g4_i1.p1  ORF type:complete len:680 (-),score=131.55 TRINITY_DN2264_c0_g4_i1:128-2167(-)
MDSRSVVLLLTAVSSGAALSSVDISRHRFDDGFDRSRGFSPLPARGVGGVNETGHDEAWPGVDSSTQRSGFHFVGGSFKGELLMGKQQVCRGTRTIGGRPHRHVPKSCFSTPGTIIKSAEGTQDVYVAKYTPDRSLIWGTHIEGPGKVQFGGLAVGNIADGGGSVQRPHPLDGVSTSNSSIPDEASAWKVGSVYPRRASSSDTVVYAAGISNNDVSVRKTPDQAPKFDEGGQDNYDRYHMKAVPHAGQVWVTKLNSSDGSVHWGRRLASCIGNESYFPNDPRNPYGERTGDCRVRGVTVDGNGDVIVTGSFWGGLHFPDTVDWAPQPEVPSAAVAEDITRDGSNKLKRAIGDLAYCQREPTCCASGAAPCLEHSTFFKYKYDETVRLEYEEGDTAFVSLLKVKDVLGIESLDMLTLQETVVTKTFEYNTQGFITGETLGTGLKEVPYSVPIAPLVTNGSQVILKVCNGTRHKTNQLMDLDNLCNLTQNDVNCVSSGSFVCPSTYYCPKTCSKHSDCLDEYLSYCTDGTCAVDLGMCEAFHGTKTANYLWSRNECDHRSGKGRYCAFDHFVAKLGRTGTFEWAVKVDSVVVDDDSTGSGWKPEGDVSGGFAKEQKYWADRAFQFFDRESELEFDTERVDMNYPTKSYPGYTVDSEAAEGISAEEKLARLEAFAKVFYKVD